MRGTEFDAGISGPGRSKNTPVRKMSEDAAVRLILRTLAGVLEVASTEPMSDTAKFPPPRDRNQLYPRPLPVRPLLGMKQAAGAL